jgi:type I restriction enzyme S subunit
VGETAIVPQTLAGWNVARAIAVVPVRPDVGAYWVRLALQSPSVRSLIDSRLNTTVQATLNLRDVAQLPILVPPQSERARISELVGALDDKIDLNRRMNETLEAMARAIFKDWFVDFGPTRAKMEARSPYLLPEIWSLFPDRLDNQGKPSGWKSGSLGEHMVNFDSKRVPVSGAERAKRQGPYPYHGATGVMDHVDNYLFDGTYLLVGEDGSVIKENGLAYTQYVWGKIWVNNHAHVLQGKEPVSTEQLLMYFQHEPVTPFVTGAVQLKLSQGRMNSMPFVFPGNRVCQKFSEVVAPLFALLKVNTDETKTLVGTRDLLLPRLMSGEIRVKEAEKAVEAVA